MNTWRLNKRTYANGRVSILLQGSVNDGASWTTQSETLQVEDCSEQYNELLKYLREWVASHHVVSHKVIS